MDRQEPAIGTQYDVGLNLKQGKAEFIDENVSMLKSTSLHMSADMYLALLKRGE